MKMTEGHKAIVKMVKQLIKKSGFKASVSGRLQCNDKIVCIAVPKYEIRFTSKQIKAFASFMLELGCTGVMKSKINLDEEIIRTNAIQFDYYV